jgi:alcohol dehydrogenase
MNSLLSVEMDLQGKVIVITGATQGLGQKMVEIITAHGAKLALVDVDHEELQNTVRLCAKAAARIKDLPADVTYERAVESLFSSVRRCRGVDTAIEAVGVPASFITCEDIVAPGGIIANIGVHGVKADLHLERLWDRNIAITTRLVDTVTTPMLLKTVQSRRVDPKRLITHHFKLDKIMDAYETFGAAAKTNALKVLIEA